MGRFVGLALLVFVGVLAWRIGGRLSDDAIGVVVGVLLSVLSGVSGALLVLVAVRARQPSTPMARRWDDPGGRALPQQPPLIVWMAPNPSSNPNAADGHGWMPTAGQPDVAAGERRFRVVGEEDRWVDE